MKYLSMFFGAVASGLMLTAGTSLAQQSKFQQNAESGDTPQQQKVDIDLDDQELKSFAKALQEIQTIQKQAREEIVTIIEEQGLTLEEYNKVSRYQQQGNEASEDVSQQQIKRFKVADSKIDELEQKLQSEIEEAITNQNLKIERFQKIRMAAKQDQNLQQKLKDIIKN